MQTEHTRQITSMQSELARIGDLMARNDTLRDQLRTVLHSREQMRAEVRAAKHAVELADRQQVRAAPKTPNPAVVRHIGQAWACSRKASAPYYTVSSVSAPELSRTTTQVPEPVPVPCSALPCCLPAAFWDPLPAGHRQPDALRLRQPLRPGGLRLRRLRTVSTFHGGPPHGQPPGHGAGAGQAGSGGGGGGGPHLQCELGDSGGRGDRRVAW